MLSLIIQRDIVEASKVAGFVFTVSAASLLLNDRYTIRQSPFESAVWPS